MLNRMPVWARWTLLAVIVVAIILFIWLGIPLLQLAYDAGKLPFQGEATRVPVTPFGDIPGFSLPTPIPTVAP